MAGDGFPAPVGFLIGGVLLWDLLFRTQLGISVAFLEETWSRNVVPLLASPLRPLEYVAGAGMWGAVKLGAGWSATALVAWGLFSFGILEAGLPLAVFAGALLIFGLALALVVLGLVFRFGSGAEILSWGVAVVVMPLSAIFYPVSVLPPAAQAAALAMPPAHVFEAMRSVLDGAPPPWGRLGIALALDAAYLAAAALFARAMFGTLRRRGYVTRYM